MKNHCASARRPEDDLPPGSPSEGRSSPRPRRLPSKAVIIELVEIARTWIFPQLADTDLPAEQLRHTALEQLGGTLTNQVAKALSCRDRDGRLNNYDDLSRTRAAGKITEAFVAQLPDVQAQLESDVQAAYDGDPSLLCEDEVILCCPGLLALSCYRLAHLLYRLQVPVIPRLITEYGHSLTGIDIHPGARIGERFFIDHGTGVVIGATTVIGNRVRLYQGVTLGARSFKKTRDGRLLKGEPRHPILEDGVVVYSGASILGRIRIGRGSVVGGNVWVTNDVPPGSLITQARVQRSEFNHGAGI